MTARIVRRDAAGSREALRLLRRGEVVVLPSVLVYGLFGDATNPDVVDRLATLKSRRERLPLPVLASPESAGRYGDLPERVSRAIALAWPNGMSFIVPRLPTIPDFVTNGPTVLLFSPDAWLAELADAAGFPIVGTSANAAGEPPSLTAADAFDRFGKEVNLIVDGGTSRFGKSTTIIDATRAPPRLVREGAVTRDGVRAVLRDVVA